MRHRSIGALLGLRVILVANIVLAFVGACADPPKSVRS
jgi:hypothetical protein